MVITIPHAIVFAVSLVDGELLQRRFPLAFASGYAKNMKTASTKRKEQSKLHFLHSNRFRQVASLTLLAIIVARWYRHVPGFSSQVGT